MEPAHRGIGGDLRKLRLGLFERFDVDLFPHRGLAEQRARGQIGGNLIPGRRWLFCNFAKPFACVRKPACVEQRCGNLVRAVCANDRRNPGAGLLRIEGSPAQLPNTWS